jgi:PAS domain S-box-containing protein
MVLRPAPDKPPGPTDQFQLLLDAVSDYAIYMLDLRGMITTWNSGAQKSSGYAPAQIIGQHFSGLFAAEDQAAGLPDKMLREACARGRCETEGWRVRQDGSRFWALAVMQTVRTPSGEHVGFAEVTRDATEREAAHRALLESERRFRILVEGLTDYAVYMLDPSGIVTNWNPGAQRIKGYAADEIVGQHFSRFYTREDRAAGLPARVLAVAAQEGRYEAEGWRVRQDGGRFWASVVVDAIRGENGELLGFAKITRDITERRQAQEALSESERQFRLLVNGVTDYALYMLDPNGIVTNWNSGAQRIKGYLADEIVGQHFSNFYIEAERAAGVPARALHTAMTEGRFEAEGWRVRKDGGRFWANVVIDPIRDEHGKLIGFAKITRDITERRDAEIALQQMQAQLVQAQKMEALGQLTGGVAHDFNNLLMIVSGYVQTLKKATPDDAKAQRAAEAIELAVRRGESLTRQLLTFSRRQSLNPVVVELHGSIDALRGMLASALGSSITLAASIARDVWPVEVDPNELELALVNVTLNARDAMPRGGIITIAAENMRLEPSDTPQNIAGDFVALTVVDSGQGIAPDILPKVFDPFFTTKGTGKGTGLGLSQVYGFAHQSGGAIDIKSEINRGTVVTLYLPRARLQQPTAASEDGVATGPAPGSVLLVEDNPDVADVSAMLLQQLGYVVTAVSDAAAAMAALTERKFDAVVSDIVMAGAMNGLDLARAARKRDARLPVLLVTGFSTVADEAAREFPVLRKPYQVADLNRALARAIADATGSPVNLVRLDQAKRSRAAKQDRPGG